MLTACNLAAQPWRLGCRSLTGVMNSRCAAASGGPTTATPPPDAARGATADLCDVFITDPVDAVRESDVAIVEPIFRYLADNMD